MATAAQSRVDLNPHQVEAALFALRGTERSSAFSRGVLLADEVGLGKTIEAGLVLAQHWAARKRRLLLVVPASLRKQWQSELIDKFLLDSEVVDAQTAKAHAGNPFERAAIVIVSYEYAASRAEALAAVDWNLVVFDEAHRLRSLHRGGKRAERLLAALGERQKILLTATPFQNSLIELWSLVHFIDKDYFGDQKSFELQYRGRNVPPEKLAELSKRMRPISQRMLRRQIAADGQISFTRRYAITLDFSPQPDEERLYHAVSDWLQNLESVSFPARARHLVTLVLRKILASSSFAIGDTIDNVIQRLRQQQTIAFDDLEQIENREDLNEGDDAVAPERIVDAKKLAAELVLLEGHRDLARRIETNAKGDALLIALSRAFAQNEALAGSARKAVVFTESVRTQKYLKEWLEANGYAGKVVLMNGQNTDPSSKAIYQRWLARHRDTAQISGSKTADMKAAIVEAFRDDAEILIATESGAEGINLQFCQILVNYDLPWNPQRIEQRIGRVHRYGQKCDVIVVNFVNTKNQVDKLVYDILSVKLRLFEGVFGASDEVLGAIEAGIDLERRINDILSVRRGEDEVQAEFAQLQSELDDMLRATEARTREQVLAHFDEEVKRLLRMRREATTIGLSDREMVWQAFAAGALGAIEREAGGGTLLEIDSTSYALRWQLAEQVNAALVREQDEPFAAALAHWQACPEQRVGLRLSYAALRHTLSALAPWIGSRGMLVCRWLRTQDFDAGDYLLVAACTDEGRPLDPDVAARLLLVPATECALRGEAEKDVQTWATVIESRQLGELDARNRRWFEQESERLDRWGDDQNASREAKVKELDREIKELRKEMRAVEVFDQRVAIKREIAKVEGKRDEAMMEFYAAKKAITQQVDAMIEQAVARLATKPERHDLFTIEWELTDE